MRKTISTMPFLAFTSYYKAWRFSNSTAPKNHYIGVSGVEKGSVGQDYWDYLSVFGGFWDLCQEICRSPTDQREVIRDLEKAGALRELVRNREWSLSALIHTNIHYIRIPFVFKGNFFLATWGSPMLITSEYVSEGAHRAGEGLNFFSTKCPVIAR